MIQNPIIQEMLDEVVIYVERHNVSVEEAVEALWPKLMSKLTGKDMLQLAQRGFSATVHRLFNKMRYTGPSAPPNSYSVRAPDGGDGGVTTITARVTVWDTVRYTTSDGGTAPIGKFLIVDWENLRDTASEKAKGEARVARFAGRMIRTLNKHGVDRTADLPAEVLAELAAASPWAAD